MTTACNLHYATTWVHSKNNRTSNETRSLTDEEVAINTGAILTGLLFWPAAIGGFVIGGPLGSAAAVGSLSTFGAGVGLLVYKLSKK